MTWPPNYTQIFAERQRRYVEMCKNPAMVAGALEYYKTRPAEYINDWGVTYDPRNAGSDKPTLMPFVLFKRQWEFIEWLHGCVTDQEHGLAEKCRDTGATWMCCAYSIWAWRFLHGSSIGWGSRKENLVDKIGDPDSIFEKMRMLIDNMPRFFWPKGFDDQKHISFMKIINPQNGSTITGEAGDSIGRGGRKLIYFKDESSHYERPEKIESALGDNTNVQIDISSVNGTSNVFYRRRKAGQIWSPGKQIPKGVTRVFVLDWRDHPAKDQAWYDQRRAKAEREGLLGIFAQEVDRDYTSAVEGIVIPAAWVQSAIDAHKKLGFDDSGAKIAALDVADEGIDKHALAVRHGAILNHIEEWPQGDTGKATRKSVSICQEKGVTEFDYDCIGVGAGVKAETNRLKEDKKIKFHVAKWNSSVGPLNPNAHILKNEDGTPDKESPKNKDFYANLKAQGWWKLRTRFEKTHRAVHEGVKYPFDELISIPANLPMRHEVENELSQPVAIRNGRGQILIDKKPKGSTSPNKADAIMMAFWPMPIKLNDFSALSIEGESLWNL